MGKGWPGKALDQELLETLLAEDISPAVAQAMSDEELLALPNVGKGRLSQIRQALSKLDLSEPPTAWDLADSLTLDRLLDLILESGGLSAQERQLQERLESVRQTRIHLGGQLSERAIILAEASGVPTPDKTPLIFDGSRFKVDTADGAVGISLKIPSRLLEAHRKDKQEKKAGASDEPEEIKDDASEEDVRRDSAEDEVG